MGLCLFSGRQFEDTFENTLCRKVKQMQMQPMCLYLFSSRLFEETFENWQWRKSNKCNQLSAREEEKSGCLIRGKVTFVKLFSTVCSQVSSWIACQWETKVTLVAFFYFSPLWAFNISSNGLPEKRQSQIGCICLTFLHCVLSMFAQIVCQRKFKVTLFAFVWLFSIMSFQMCHENACLRRGKVKLVTFFRLFFTVRFQMSPWIVCPKKGKVTLIAFVRLFSAVCFQMSPQIVYLKKAKSH